MDGSRCGGEPTAAQYRSLAAEARLLADHVDDGRGELADGMLYVARACEAAAEQAQAVEDDLDALERASAAVEATLELADTPSLGGGGRSIRGAAQGYPEAVDEEAARLLDEAAAMLQRAKERQLNARERIAESEALIRRVRELKAKLERRDGA